MFFSGHPSECACFLQVASGRKDWMQPRSPCGLPPADHSHRPGSHQQSHFHPSDIRKHWGYFPWNCSIGSITFQTWSDSFNWKCLGQPGTSTFCAQVCLFAVLFISYQQSSPRDLVYSFGEIVLSVELFWVVLAKVSLRLIGTLCSLLQLPHRQL